jgi:hypothetical protein
MKNNHKQKLITEVGRMKELMLLKEAVTPIPLFRTAMVKLIEKSSPYLKMWDEIFQSTTQAERNAINSTRNTLSNKASFNNLGDDTLEVLLSTRNSKLFANMILDAWNLNKKIDNIFLTIEKNPPPAGQSFDYTALKQRIMGMVDEIPELDTIPGLRDQISDNIDESIELSRRGNYAVSKGLYELLSMDEMFKIIGFGPDQIKKVKKIPGFEDNFRQWIKGTNGKQIDEVTDQLREKILENIKKMTQPDFQKNWAKLDNQKTMTTWEKLLDNTKIWVNQRYGPEFVNASGVIEKRWWLTRFGKVLLDAFVIDFVLSNFIEGISAIAPGDDFDMQYGHLYLLLSFLIGFTVQTGTKTKETLFAITEDDAKKFANSDQYLKSLLNDPKNDYQFIKSEDDEIVKMLNFSDEDNMDSDFAIFKGWDSNFDYVEIKPKEDDESIIDKIGKKIDEL